MYGGGLKDKLNENSLLDPKSPYAAQKFFPITQKHIEILIIYFA